jgi:hypothetical protein
VSTLDANIAQETDPTGARDKLSKLKKRDYIVGDSDDIVHMDWSNEWSELKKLEPLSDDHDPD